MESLIKVEVRDYKFSQIDNNVILYTVAVAKRDGQQWTIEKRYSEFDDLNNMFKKVIILSNEL